MGTLTAVAIGVLVVGVLAALWVLDRRQKRRRGYGDPYDPSTNAGLNHALAEHDARHTQRNGLNGY